MRGFMLLVEHPDDVPKKAEIIGILKFSVPQENEAA